MNDLERNKRFAIVKAECIACRKRGYPDTPADAHHLLSTGRHGNGKRRGDEATIGLCKWHHVGNPEGRNEATLFRMLGPSYFKHARQFREVFGSDDELLAEQNQLIRGAYL